MTKPTEETWITINGSCGRVVIPAEDDGLPPIQQRWIVPPSAISETVARLIATAPEMARMLLAEEWSGRDGAQCDRCSQWEHEGHAADCPWLALMNKAGIR